MRGLALPGLASLAGTYDLHAALAGLPGSPNIGRHNNIHTKSACLSSNTKPIQHWPICPAHTTPRQHWPAWKAHGIGVVSLKALSRTLKATRQGIGAYVWWGTERFSASPPQAQPSGHLCRRSSLVSSGDRRAACRKGCSLRRGSQC